MQKQNGLFTLFKQLRQGMSKMEQYDSREAEVCIRLLISAAQTSRDPWKLRIAKPQLLRTRDKRRLLDGIYWLMSMK